MMVTRARCGGKAFRNAKGKLLAHTTSAKGGERKEHSIGWYHFTTTIDTGPYVPAEVCE